ncbi:hypothetical protein M5J20_05165 [Corynebacterium sp. TA-R-1]|uniref:Metallothionein n=1 Tax=Corynebacterium stercoris TaxID=2943490 RepID=A0ABT1G159_9CORY|nr:hypothetical protein [Corynebacterium stercoris]MCP1387577.1 hypothetical protein [Corynebacterium stercoris]
MTTPNNEGLYTNGADLNTEAKSSCGCGHHKPVETTEVREEIKIVPADHAATREGATCNCEPGHCNCGHHQTCDCAPNECKCGHNDGLKETAPAEQSSCCGGHGHGHHGLTEEEYYDPDKTDTHGVDPAVKTVEEAQGYDESAGWNDGIRPTDAGEAAESGAGKSDDGQIN